jgi:hypothetical protein
MSAVLLILAQGASLPLKKRNYAFKVSVIPVPYWSLSFRHVVATSSAPAGSHKIDADDSIVGNKVFSFI